VALNPAMSSQRISTGQPCENAFPHLSRLALTGVLRLRICFALRSRRYAQDDTVFSFLHEKRILHPEGEPTHSHRLRARSRSAEISPLRRILAKGISIFGPWRQRRALVRDCRGGVPCPGESARGHTRLAYPGDRECQTKRTYPNAHSATTACAVAGGTLSTLYQPCPHRPAHNLVQDVDTSFLIYVDG
jgi:hypothetical protein